MTDAEPSLDSSDVIKAITELMLGESPQLTRADVSELSGVDPDIAKQRWRALGFPEADDGDAAFTHADVEALKLTQELVELGIIEADTEQAFIRTIGRSFARLAEWQVRAFLGSMASGSQDEMAAGDLAELEKVVPLGEKVQAYVWRRHLVNAASRLLLTEAGDVDASPMVVGFADIVGYTSRSRTMTRQELTDMVERFEEVTAGLITDHHGHVVKTIGDEVLFVADDAASGGPAGAGAARPARGRRGVPPGPHRHGPRQRPQPHGRRLRPGGQRRVTADLGGQTGQLRHRPRDGRSPA